MSTNEKPLNALLVGIQLPNVSFSELENSLQELTRLVTTLGYKVVGQITQKRNSDRSASILGAGKLVELAYWTGGTGKIASVVEHKLSKAAAKWKKEEDSNNTSKGTPDDGIEDTIEDSLDELPHGLSEDKKGTAQIVIVDTELTPSQVRNLESACGVQVLDRTGVIIEIFSRHARTKTARLQVEIARLNYVAPRLRETSGNEDRQGGGVGGKGAGESSLELDKRKIRDRIKELKSELSQIGNEHLIRRTRRKKEISVALVGYTNAGKSSLMRAMTGSEVLVADKLFATLDTTVRPLVPETRPKVLLSDTVGFIKKLPHDLVASFKSTLDEALNASLLLFVVDSSDPQFESQLEVTQKVLSEVGADEIPRLLVFNKKDRLNQEHYLAIKNTYPEGIFISTRNPDDILNLRDKIMSYFEDNMIDDDLFIPYTSKGIIGEIRRSMRVLGEFYNESGSTLKVRSTKEKIDQMKKKLEK